VVFCFAMVHLLCKRTMLSRLKPKASKLKKEL